MPVDSAGNSTRPPSPIPVSGQTADAPQVNVPIDDIYSILNMLLFADGRKAMRGPLNMNGYRITGLAEGVAPDEAATVGQVSGITGTPAGILSPFAGDTPPSGWLLCYGQQVSRATYPRLFSAIGTKFGAGNGTTTFNLPDYRGRAIVGVDNMGGAPSGRISDAGAEATKVGGVFGAQSVTLNVDQMPAHSHTVSGSTNSAGEHSHTYSERMDTTIRPETNSSLPQVSANHVFNRVNRETEIAGSHSHTISVTAQNTGGGEAHPNLQPSMAANIIIKT